MEILLQLGANGTAFIQFFLFVITISFLTMVVYKPFFLAYDERHKLTKGADQVAYETQDEAKKLTQIYESRAREINTKINQVFETSRLDAMKSYGVIIDAAKGAVTLTSSAALKKIEAEKQSAGQQVKIVASEVSNEIVKKLMGNV